MSEPALAVHGLRKSFGAKEAVAGIDLEIAAGSLSGLVGPNGAGKTTSLSMMTGLLRPDAGQVLVNGLDVWADPPAAKAVIGVVPAEASTGSKRQKSVARQMFLEVALDLDVVVSRPLQHAVAHEVAALERLRFSSPRATRDARVIAHAQRLTAACSRPRASYRR